MAKDQDAQFNISSEVVEGGTSGGSAGGAVPYPDAPADTAAALSPYGAAVDLDAMARVDRTALRQSVTMSAPDRDEIKNVYGGSITPPWAREQSPNYPVAAPMAVMSETNLAPIASNMAAAPPPPFDTYAEYQQATADYRTDIANAWVQQGRGGEVGSKAFQGAVAEDLVLRGLAPPPEPPPDPGAYEQHRQRRGAVERQTQDFYAGLGQADLIGTPAYRDMLQQNLLDEGVIDDEAYRAGSDAMFGRKPKDRLPLVERTIENIRESASGFGALNYGYAASQLAEGGARLYEQTNTGHTLTQEARTTAETDVLPGAFAVAGTVAGAAFGEMGAWAGGIVGAGAGTAIQGIVGTNDDIAQSTRQSAELLAAALGQAAESVANFRSQIEQTGAPAKDFAAVLGSVGGAGNFGAGTVAGVGALTNALGEYAQGDAPVIGKYLASPVNYGIASRAAGGDLSAGDLDALGFDAAIQGDFAGLKTLQRDAQRAQVAEDPSMKAAAAASASAAARPWWQKALGIRTGDEAAAPDVMQALRRGAPADPNVAAENALADTFAGIREQDLVDQPAAANARGQLGILTASGGSVAAVSAAAGAYESDLSGLTALNDRKIKALQDTIASPFFASLPDKDRDAERQALAEAQTQDTQYGAEAAGARRESFQYGLGAETAGFGLSQTRAELGGASAADLLDTRRRQAQYLETTAADPRSPLAPSERAGIEEQAARMRYGAQQQVYGQALAGDDLGIAQAATGVARAEASGTAGDVSSAQGAEIETFRAKVAELSQELSRGGLTVDDRIAKERELNQTVQQGVEMTAQRRRDFAAATEANDADRITVDTAGMPRQMRVGGAASVDVGAVDRDFARLVSDDRSALAAAPPGSREYNAAAAKLAVDDQRRVDTDDQMNVYQPGARLATQEIREGSALRRAEHGFSRSQEAPYADGSPESNPFTRGVALEAEIGRSSALVGTEVADLSAFRASRQRAGHWDAAAEQGYEGKMAGLVDQQEGLLDRRASLEHDRVFNAFAALPDMIAGSPGSGVSAGVLPTAAMAAFFTPGPQFGGFGRTPGENLPGAGAAVREGGVYGGFNTATGAGETVQVLRQILAQLSGNRPPLVTSAPVNSLGAIVSQEHSTLDWTRRR